ncbi:hypothetical protein NXV51_00705 [Bacteroides uniformis]|nr:hypothetical protein [Bacteroides uniformis]
MLATESRGTDMVADITGYNWYSNSADYSDCLNTSTATIEFSKGYIVQSDFYSQ